MTDYETVRLDIYLRHGYQLGVPGVLTYDVKTRGNNVTDLSWKHAPGARTRLLFVDLSDIVAIVERPDVLPPRHAPAT